MPVFDAVQAGDVPGFEQLGIWWCFQHGLVVSRLAYHGPLARASWEEDLVQARRRLADRAAQEDRYRAQAEYAQELANRLAEVEQSAVDRLNEGGRGRSSAR